MTELIEIFNISDSFFEEFIILTILKEVEHVIHRSQYEDQFDVKLETKDDKVVVIKEKKMREAKRRLENLSN